MVDASPSLNLDNETILQDMDSQVIRVVSFNFVVGVYRALYFCLYLRSFLAHHALIIDLQLPGSSDTAASFQIDNEDHTLGNALRYIIMKK